MLEGSVQQFKVEVGGKEGMRIGEMSMAGRVSVCGGAAVPEAGPEVVAACHEAGVGGRVDDAADDVVVTQRQQVFPLGRARVPAAQADGALVRQ